MASGPKVLIIDDQASVISAVGLTLKRAGFQVLSSQTVMCLDLIFREQPDLILLDVEMPGIGGQTAAHILSKEKASIRGKIVFHSSRDPDELRKMALVTRIDGYITKANNPVRFIQQVRDLIGSGEVARSVVTPQIREPARPDAASRMSDPSRSDPARAAANPHWVPSSAPVRGGHAVFPVPPRAHVILVDSDEALLCFLRMNLVTMGIRTHTSGGSGFDDLIAAKCPQTVILNNLVVDYPLDDVRRMLRARSGVEGLKVFLLAREGTLGPDRLAKDASLDGFVLKSSNWALLAREVRELAIRNAV